MWAAPSSPRSFTLIELLVMIAIIAILAALLLPSLASAKELEQTPRVLFCPGRDQPLDAEKELSNVGKRQAQGSYFCRHAGVTQLFHTPAEMTLHLQLDNLGVNRNGHPSRALAVDMNLISPPGLESFNVITRTQHRQRTAQILHGDGCVASRRNTDGRFTVDVSDYADLCNAFGRILAVLEQADTEY